MYEQTPRNESKGRQVQIGKEDQGGLKIHCESKGGSSSEEGIGKRRKVFIYSLDDPISGAIRYVGKTTNLKLRSLSHKRLTKDHRGYWIQSLMEQGLYPVISLLEEVYEDEWQEAEKFWIGYLRFLGCNLCNTSEGGFGGSPTPESRAKTSASLKGRIITPEHREKLRNALKGRKPSEATYEARKLGYTEEWRAKVSASKMGTKLPPRSAEYRAKISLRHKGKKIPEHMKEALRNRIVSEETRKKMSEAKKGRKLSPETRAKMSAARKGRRGVPMTPEHKAKLIALHLGKPWSEESKEKLRSTMKATNAVQRLRDAKARKIL